MVHVNPIFFFRHIILVVFLSLLFLGLSSELFVIFIFVITYLPFPEDVANNSIREVFRIYFCLLKPLQIMSLHLLVKGFLYFLFNMIFLHGFSSNSIIFHHSFSLSSLVNKPVLHFHLFHSLLLIKLTVVLIDPLVLSKVFLRRSSIIMMIILILQILLVNLKFNNFINLSFSLFLL